MLLDTASHWLGFIRDRSARNSNELAFLPAALEIIETPASPAGRLVAATIATAVLFALGWACIGQVDVIANASGRIVPVGKSKIVQPMEIGIVKSIDVAEGDHVRAGDLLIELDPTQSTADRDKYAHDLLQARLDLARLQGLRVTLNSNTDAELVAPPENAPPTELDAARAAMRAEAGEQTAKLASLDQQVAEKAAEIEETSASIAKVRATLPLVREQAEIRLKLKKMEYGNKIAYLEAQQAYLEQQNELIILARHSDQAQAQKLALERQREQTAAEYEKKLLDELAKARQQVSELDAEVTKVQQKLTLQTLRAPIDGTVQQLSVHTIGGVVTPAQPLLTIVPDTGGLMVEAMVDNHDVGFVHEGQKAEVKIDTFNFTRYGLVDGKVSTLSRDAVTEPADNKDRSSDTKNVGTPSEPSYVAHVALSRDWMETEAGRVPLGPGMAVNVEIHTGRRVVIDYLLSPLARHVEESFGER